MCILHKSYYRDCESLPMTHFTLLIYYNFAEVAETVFNKCTQYQKSSHNECPQLTFDFEFLDDFRPISVTPEAE